MQYCHALYFVLLLFSYACYESKKVLGHSLFYSNEGNEQEKNTVVTMDINYLHTVTLTLI
jgi:hypothetical protein